MALSTFNLNGVWASGGAAGPLIATVDSLSTGGADPNGNFFTVDMSAFPALPSLNEGPIGRPIAYGTIHDATHIDISFPDDADYTAELIPANSSTGAPDTILFSNDASWTRVPDFWGGDTLIPLEGRWASDGVAGPFIHLNLIDMSFYSRPTAKTAFQMFGSFFAYLAEPQPNWAFLKASPPSLIWNNGSVWTPVTPSFGALWKESGDILTLIITGVNYPADQAVIGQIKSATLNLSFQTTTTYKGEFSFSTPVVCRTGEQFVISAHLQPSPLIGTNQYAGSAGTTCPRTTQL